MKQTIDLYNKILKKIKPSKKELEEIKYISGEITTKIQEKINKRGIGAEICIGGSFAKKTIIKKDKYDIDLFIRFGGEYKDKDISSITEKIIEGCRFSGVEKIHGSRDYFRIIKNSQLYFEIIPVMKVKNEAANITDLSYSHVNYIKKKISSEKIIDEILITKYFCHLNNCYGAESYIRGFSGYGIELLICHYKSFENFLRAVAKNKGEKMFIDQEKHYKNKNEIMMDINSSKLNSPIILIDPTHKQRNALAALPDETFKKFRNYSKKFLKNPNERNFFQKKLSIDELKKTAIAKNRNFAAVIAETDKQEGDIAGSKLMKFYNHLISEIEKKYALEKKSFEYHHKKEAEYFFEVSKAKEIIFNGPYSKDKENCEKFKKKHKRIFEKKGRIYAIGKTDTGIKKFLKEWIIKNKKMIDEMYIRDVKVE